MPVTMRLHIAAAAAAAAAARELVVLIPTSSAPDDCLEWPSGLFFLPWQLRFVQLYF